MNMKMKKHIQKNPQNGKVSDKKKPLRAFLKRGGPKEHLQLSMVMHRYS